MLETANIKWPALFGPIGRRHLVGAAIVVAVLGLSKLAAMLSSILIARMLDKSDAGLVFFLTGLVTLSMSFTTLGLTSATSFYYARNQARGRQRRNYQIILLCVVVAVVPSLLAAALGGLTAPDSSQPLWLIVSTLAVCCYFAAFRLLARYVFIVEGQRKWSLFHDSISFNVALIALVAAVPNVSYDWMVAALIMASVGSGTLAAVHVLAVAAPSPTGRLGIPPTRYTKRLLALSIPGMIAQGGGVLLNKIDVVMIAPLAGAIAVSDYSVALRLTYVAAVAGEVVMAVFGGRLANTTARDNAGQRWALVRRVTILQLLAIVVSAGPLMLFAGPTITLLFGQGYEASTVPFLILQGGKLLTAAFAPALIVFTAMGYSRMLATNALVVAAVNITLNFALVPPFGATGAAIATSVALLLMAAAYVRLILRLRRAAEAPQRAEGA